MKIIVTDSDDRVLGEFIKRPEEIPNRWDFFVDDTKFPTYQDGGLSYDYVVTAIRLIAGAGYSPEEVFNRRFIIPDAFADLYDYP